MINKVVTYSEIAELCQTDAGIEQLKDYVKEVAKVIDEYTLDFINDAKFTIEEYEVIQKRLTGCVMYLNPIRAYGDTIKRNSVLRKYMELKTNFMPETPKDKFVSSSAEHEAEASVAQFREVRNMVEGYLKSAEAGIYTCKDKIKERNVEKNNVE